MCSFAMVRQHSNRKYFSKSIPVHQENNSFFSFTPLTHKYEPKAIQFKMKCLPETRTFLKTRTAPIFTFNLTKFRPWVLYYKNNDFALFQAFYYSILSSFSNHLLLINKYFNTALHIKPSLCWVKHSKDFLRRQTRLTVVVVSTIFYFKLNVITPFWSPWIFYDLTFLKWPNCMQFRKQEIS